MTIPTLFLLSAAIAAPPKVDYLFPGGGQQGQKVEVLLGGTVDPWPVQSWASHPGLHVTPQKASGKIVVAIAPEVPPGTHYLRFHNADGPGPLRPFLVNQVPEIAEKEPNDDPKKPQEIKEPAAIINGRLEKNNDTDVFQVHLKKGQTLVAAVEAYHTLRSPMDAVLQIVSPEGFVLAQNDDFRAMDPLIPFTAPRDGAYLVRIFCFPSTPDSRVGLYGKENCVYRLTLTTDPYVDYAWPLAVQRSKPGEVTLVGWNIPPGKEKGVVISEKDSDLAFLQPPGFANGVFIRIEDHPTMIAGDEVVKLPATLSGRLKDALGQKVRFEAKKGQKVAFRIESRDLHFPLDPVLILTDPTGKRLQRVQAAKLNTDPVLEFTPAMDGVHVLEVRDLHEEASPRHVFRLRALPAVPDFDVVLATDRFTGTEAPATLTRRNGLKAPIEFIAEGLPPGTRIEETPGKDKKGVALRVIGTPAKGPHPFRLFAQVQGKPETRRPVLANLAELDAAVPYLWLDVRKK